MAKNYLLRYKRLARNDIQELFERELAKVQLLLSETNESNFEFSKDPSIGGKVLERTISNNQVYYSLFIFDRAYNSYKFHDDISVFKMILYIPPFEYGVKNVTLYIKLFYICIYM